MSFTEPAYALPIVLDGTETITVDMTTGATDFVAVADKIRLLCN